MILKALYICIHMFGWSFNRWVPEYIIIENPILQRIHDMIWWVWLYTSFTKLYATYIFICLKKLVCSFSFCTATFLDFWLALRCAFFPIFLFSFETVSHGVVLTDSWWIDPLDVVLTGAGGINAALFSLVSEEGLLMF